MKTRFAVLTLMFSVISCGIFAQQENKLHYTQAGITFSSLNNFGLTFKTGGEKTLLRVSLLSLNLGKSSNQGRVQDSIDASTSSYGVGFRLGFERHLPIYNHFDFIWGFEAGCSYTNQKQKRNMSGLYNDYESNSWSIIPLADVILGVTYTISDHLVLGAEITPGVQYSFGKTKTTNYTGITSTTEQTNKNFNFGFNNNAASLSLAYRFGK
ncbi:MAG: hypothetical protein WCK34_13740 [Bacteroidota bacterium]